MKRKSIALACILSLMLASPVLADFREYYEAGQQYLYQSQYSSSIDSFKNELIFLAGKSVTHCPGENIWDEAFIGLKDAIIAPLNQERGWRDLALNVVKLDVSHYSAQFFKEKLE